MANKRLEGGERIGGWKQARGRKEKTPRKTWKTGKKAKGLAPLGSLQHSTPWKRKT